jgi:tetratricopeptide (TPR) repeat protein
MVRKIIAAGILVCVLFLFGEAPRTTALALSSFQEGLRAATTGQLDRAIEFWSDSLRRNPRAYAARVNRGSAYLLTGHVMKGIDDWSRARKYSPIFAYGLYRPYFIDQAPRNRRMLNFALPLELDPDHIGSVLMMGSAYLDFGRDRVAVRLFKKSIGLTRNPMLKNHLQHWIKSIQESSRK